MRRQKAKTTGLSDPFRAWLDRIINMKHELEQLAGKVDEDWIDCEIAPPSDTARAVRNNLRQYRRMTPVSNSIPR